MLSLQNYLCVQSTALFVRYNKTYNTKNNLDKDQTECGPEYLEGGNYQARTIIDIYINKNKYSYLGFFFLRKIL